MLVCHLIRRITLSLAVLFMAAGPGATTSWAQKPKPEPGKKTDKPDKNAKPDGAQPNTSMEIAKVEGKWDAFSQGVIKILNAENQEVFLHSENDTVINFTAEAEPAWLMPGVMVRFSASFDQSFKPTAALKAIEVFTPLMQRRLSPQEMREQTPGIHQEEKGQPEAAKADNNKTQVRNRPASKKDAIVPGQSLRVVGQLVGVQSNVLQVNAGNLIQIEIDPAATVTVTAHDLPSVAQLITKGDAVTVSGLRNPAQPNHVYCEQITIKPAKKLTQAMPQTKRGKTSARDKDKDADTKGTKDGKDGKAKPDTKKPTASDKKPQ